MRRLERYIVAGGKQLRMGYTTGSCAAAAARAAALLLLERQPPASVRIGTPGGIDLTLDVEAAALEGDLARCAVYKDGGDDPDVTHGAAIACIVRRIPAGFTVDGGIGVGRVTREGLSVPVGEAAINPVPRRMILEQLQQAAEECGYSGGLHAEVEVPEGEALAARTFNSRLGIRGGISILGTTGLVEPMSEAALVATIRLELDRLATDGRRSVLLVPGNYGQDYAQKAWGLSLEQGVKCSNFVGEALDYAAYKGFRTLLLMGHGGKLVKLAAGIFNTHSRVADGRMEILAAHGGVAGLDAGQLRELMECVSVDAADGLLVGWGKADEVWSGVSEKIAAQLAWRCGPEVEVAFALFGGRGLLARSGEIERIVGEING